MGIKDYVYEQIAAMVLSSGVSAEKSVTQRHRCAANFSEIVKGSGMLPGKIL